MKPVHRRAVHTDPPTDPRRELTVREYPQTDATHPPNRPHLLRLFFEAFRVDIARSQEAISRREPAGGARW